MIYRKLICFSCFLLVSTGAFSQKKLFGKLEKSLSIGLCYNSFSSINTQITSGIPFRNKSEIERTWQFQNQPSLTAGLALKNKLTNRFATQIEFNLLSMHQKGSFSESKVIDNNASTAVGTVRFSTLYVQIPLTICLKLEEKSDIELGVSQTFALLNLSNKNVTYTVFSEQVGDINAPITTFSPPKIEQTDGRINMFNFNSNFIIGVNYRFNPKTTLRIRYEKGLDRFCEYNELLQSNLSLSILFKKQ